MKILGGLIVTIIGLLLVLALIVPTVFTGMWFNWVIAILVLIFGIKMLIMSSKCCDKK